MKTKLLLAMLLFATFTITSCTNDDMDSTKIENQTIQKDGETEEPGDPVIPKGRD